MKFYHLTTEENFKSIMKSMWISRGTSVDNYDNGVTGVFLSGNKNPNITRWHEWVAREWDGIETLACLEIEIPESEWDKIQPDPVANNLCSDEHKEEYPELGLTTWKEWRVMSDGERWEFESCGGSLEDWV